MNSTTFVKYLSANDCGTTGSHQAGILVPRANRELLTFFATLDPSELNPDAWIYCEDENGQRWKFRYIYYNNKLHVSTGTRNEYRITHLTKYLRSVGAAESDCLAFSLDRDSDTFKVRLEKAVHINERTSKTVVLRGWRKVH